MDAKAAAKRKAEEERISKLSPAEQKKVINWIHVTAYLNSGYFLYRNWKRNGGVNSASRRAKWSESDTMILTSYTILLPASFIESR